MATVAITESNFEQTVKQGIVLLDWWASWCGPCRAFAPTFEQASDRHPDVVFGKVDTEDQPALAAAFEIRAIPTLMVFRDGVLIFSRPGVVPGEALDSLISQARGLNMDEVRKEIAEAQAEAEKKGE